MRYTRLVLILALTAPLVAQSVSVSKSNGAFTFTNTDKNRSS